MNDTTTKNAPKTQPINLDRLFPFNPTPQGGVTKKERQRVRAQRAVVRALLLDHAEKSRTVAALETRVAQLAMGNEDLSGEMRRMHDALNEASDSTRRQKYELQSVQHKLARAELRDRARDTMARFSDALDIGVQSIKSEEGVTPTLSFTVGGLRVEINPYGELITIVSAPSTPIKLRRQEIYTYRGRLNHKAISQLRGLLRAVTPEGYQEYIRLLVLGDDATLLAELYHIPRTEESFRAQLGGVTLRDRGYRLPGSTTP
jgi:hypothetical protein